MEWRNQVAVVTGGSRGIGRQTSGTAKRGLLRPRLARTSWSRAPPGERGTRARGRLMMASQSA
jgi:hypothetical protein